MNSIDWLAGAGQPLHGEIIVPGDKSVSHRSIMLGAIANGQTTVHGFLEGEDTRATAAVFAKLGVRIEAPQASVRIVHGVGLHGLHGADSPLDCGNAGTGMRLLTGLLAGQKFASELIGDESLSRRPMRRVIDPLSQMGARIDSQDGLPPLIIHANNTLQSIDYKTKIASAQVKSAILLAGLYAKGITRVTEPHPTRDYTERMLAAFGWPITFGEGWAQLEGGHQLQARDISVPADFSSAAFFIAAASIVPGSNVLLRDVGINPRRTGLIDALRLMGADIQQLDQRIRDGEVVADLRVRAAPLHGAQIPEGLVPDMIDEFPALFACAAVASGQTIITGAAELRVKESDRLAAMSNALRAVGVAVDETPDGAVISGGKIGSGQIDSHGDHRIAMAGAVLAQRSSSEVRINNCANVDTSFPGFLVLAKQVGFGLRR